jgi:hypothetical protein
MRVRKLADFFEGSEVAGITFEPDTLVIALGAGQSLVFADVWGFRVLDEGDLLEFWPHCSARNGGLFEVEEGGWFSQESERKGFLSVARKSDLTEFFVTGPNACVNVLAFSPPKFSGDAL